MRQEMMGVWGGQRHQLDHMQTICTSLQTDNHTSTSSINKTASLLPLVANIEFISCQQAHDAALQITSRQYRLYAFNALTLLVGYREEHPFCKN